MKQIESKKGLYVEYLQDLYSAKVHELSALHFFTNKSAANELKHTIYDHMGEVRIQMLRLEELIEAHTTDLSEKHCQTMFSMIEEAHDLVERCADPLLRDFVITSSLQRIKQCEITMGEMLLEMATEFPFKNEAATLRISLKEENLFNKRLDELQKKTSTIS